MFLTFVFISVSELLGHGCETPPTTFFPLFFRISRSRSFSPRFGQIYSLFLRCYNFFVVASRSSHFDWYLHRINIFIDFAGISNSKRYFLRNSFHCERLRKQQHHVTATKKKNSQQFFPCVIINSHFTAKLTNFHCETCDCNLTRKIKWSKWRMNGQRNKMK